MTVSARTPRTETIASGGTATFVYDFPITASGELRASVDDAPASINSVTGVGVDTGGTATLATTPTVGQIVVLYRATSKNQLLTLTPTGELDIRSVTASFDKATRIDQEIDEKLARAPTLGVGSQVRDIVVDDPVTGQYAYWTNVNGVNHLTPVDPTTASLSVTNILPGYTFGTLPATPTTGQTVRVTSGAAPGIYTYNGTQWVHVENGRFHAAEFGQKADGLTDDTTAIANAITAATSGGIAIGVVVLKPGTSIVDGLTLTGAGATLIADRGGPAGPTAAHNMCRLKAKSGSTNAMLTINIASGNKGSAVRDIVFDANNEAGVPACIDYAASQFWYNELHNVGVTNCAIGIRAVAATVAPDPNLGSFFADRVWSYNVSTVVDFGSRRNLLVTFTHSRLIGNLRSVLVGADNTTAGDSCDVFNLLHCDLSVLTEGAVDIALIRNCKNVNIRDCWIEASASITTNLPGMIVLGTASSEPQLVNIEGCFFESNGKTDYGVVVQNCVYPRITENYFNNMDVNAVQSVETASFGVYAYNRNAVVGCNVSDVTGWRYVQGDSTLANPDLWTGLKYVGTTGNDGFGAYVTGDTVPRVALRNSGQLRFGSGSATADCLITRSAANTLALQTNAVNRLFVSETLITAALPIIKTTGNLVTHDYGGSSPIADWTLTSVEEAADTFSVSNAVSAATMIFPTAVAGKVFIVKNGSGQTLTVKVSGQTGFTVADTKVTIGFMSATDCVAGPTT